jgi:drug/metabolite transporter (DMT)-like permease
VISAFLTALFFSLSSISANRAIGSVGSTRANLARLAVAVLVLGCWAHLVPMIAPGAGGTGLEGAGLIFFLISGVIGMGLGDLAVFAGLPLLGARLMVVMTQCLAAPIAAFAEWLWLGTRLHTREMAWSAVILGGVALALLPSKAHPPRVKVRASGIVFGVFAAGGQAIGAVLSRKAYDLSRAAGEHIDGLTATYQRILGGIAVTLMFFLLRHFILRLRNRGADRPSAAPNPPPVPARTLWERWRWSLANGLSGPVLGVSCYQRALSTTASGIVLPIVATTPLIVIPLSYWIEKERPTKRSLIGGVIAVAGAICLAVSRT